MPYIGMILAAIVGILILAASLMVGLVILALISIPFMMFFI